MSITDDTTGLNNTWTEQPVVAFTAGTLSTVSAMVTEVESKLKRGTLSTSTTPSTTQVQRWLTRGKQQLAALFGFTFKRRYAYVDTVASTYRYALPPDYGGGQVRLRITTDDNENVIPVVRESTFSWNHPDPTTTDNNTPEYAVIKDRELWLYPVPDTVYRLEVEYDRTGDDNTATGFGWLPELARFQICDYAVYEAFLSLHMWNQAQLYFQKWMDDVAVAKQADIKKKWAKQDYRARSWLQDYYMRRQ